MKISGLPNRRSASSKASTQKSACSVFEIFQANTARECQSMIATREMKPLASGIYVIYRFALPKGPLHQTWLTRSIVRPPSRYGYLVCSGAALLVLGRW